MQCNCKKQCASAQYVVKKLTSPPRDTTSAVKKAPGAAQCKDYICSCLVFLTSASLRTYNLQRLVVSRFLGVPSPESYSCIWPL